jgi:phosphatidylinositol glycan class B
LLAYAMPSQCWPDEIFQSLEQAHRVVFGRGIVPWEFRDGTRSWLFPGVLAGIMAATSWVTASATAYLMATAAFLSSIALAPVWVAFRWAQRTLPLRGAIVAAATCALWYELVYFAPKALTEVVSGNVLVVGVLLADVCAREPRRREALVAAACLALAAVMRIQLAPAALVCFGTMFFHLPRRLRWEVIGVAAAVVIAVGMIDAITWSYPFSSFIENLRANIVEGKSKRYGVAPWYAYFEAYAHLWGVAGVAIVALAVVGATRARLAGITALVVVATHIPIAHKEYRFVYPALVLVIVLAGMGLATLVERAAKTARTANLAAAGAIVAVFALSMSLANRYDDPGLVFGLGKQGNVVSLWTERTNYLRATREVGADPELCGLGLAALHWVQSGGYTYLHRDVPWLELLQPDEVATATPQVNVLLARPDLPDTLGPYVRGKCWNTVCIYKRPGGCAAMTPQTEKLLAGRDAGEGGLLK